MRIGQHLATAVMALVLMPPATPVTPNGPGTIYRETGPGEPSPLRHDFPGWGRNGVPIPSVASQSRRVPPSAPASAYSMDVPLAYYNLSFTLSKRTGGITPPVQGRIFAYMGLALYESIVGGMPHNRSIASSLHGIGPLPRNHGTKYWPLVASAAMAEVMRGLWGDATNVAAQNIADIDSLEQQIANSFDLQGSLARRSIDYGHAVGAAVYQTSLNDGEDRSYLTNFPTDYVPPVCDGCWVPTAPGQIALQPYWKDRHDHVRADARRLRHGRPARVLDRSALGRLPGGVRGLRHQEQHRRPSRPLSRGSGRTVPARSTAPATRCRPPARSFNLVGANLAAGGRDLCAGRARGRRRHLRRVVVQVHVQLDPPDHVHQPLHRRDLDHAAGDATVPRVHVGALGPDRLRDRHADRALGRHRLRRPHARRRWLRAAHVRAA